MSLFFAAAAALSFAGCSPSADDRRWIETAKQAWRHQLAALPALRPPSRVDVVLFDSRCQLESGDMLMRQGGASLAGRLHRGRIRVADGTSVPAAVTSFAGEGRRGPTFVMALPSLWRSNGVKSGGLTLEQLTTAVLLHEASHVAQGGLMRRVTALIRRNGWGESFDDDSIQRRFEADKTFAAAVQEETRLLFASAAATDDETARSLARSALASIDRRRARAFTGRGAALSVAEDLFLTLEGSGQYVAFSWLASPSGGGVPRGIALRDFGQRGRWWSQTQGLALILAVERLGLEGWQDKLWGQAPALAGAELLRAALTRRSG